MKLCFITNTVVKKDDLTTYDLAVSALLKGHEVSFMNVTDFCSKNNDVYGNVRTLKKKPENRTDLVKLLEQTPQAEANLQKMDAVFLRHKYKKGSKILENYHKATREYAFHLMEDGIFVLNDPRFLPFMSSKIATLGLDKSILPEKQLVSNDFNQLIAYCKDELKDEGVLKPLFGSGGNGIYFVEKKNLRNNIKALLEEGPVIAQSYIKSEGDKRILLLGGNPIAWYMRVAAEGELLHNIHAGGKPVKCDLSDRDKKIIETVKPKLVKCGMHFVGIDTLGGYLSEINSENPGGTVRADTMGGFNSRDKVIEYIEKKTKR